MHHYALSHARLPHCADFDMLALVEIVARRGHGSTKCGGWSIEEHSILMRYTVDRVGLGMWNIILLHCTIPHLKISPSTTMEDSGSQNHRCIILEPIAMSCCW